MQRIIILFLGLSLGLSLYSQESMTESLSLSARDSLIELSTEDASDYIKGLIENPRLWKPGGDSMRLSLLRLLQFSEESFDSVAVRLEGFPYDSLQPISTTLVYTDTIPYRWLNDSTFIADTLAMDRQPFLIQKTIIETRSSAPAPEKVDSLFTPAKDSMTIALAQADTALVALADTMLSEDSPGKAEQLPLIRRDTIFTQRIDSSYIQSLGLIIHNYREGRLSPGLVESRAGRSFLFDPESARGIVRDSIEAIVTGEESPFYKLPNEKMPDSLKAAVTRLLDYTWQRDSIELRINNLQGETVPFWLTGEGEELRRFWVKNAKNDSITLWVGNPDKFDLTLLLEDDINLERIEKTDVSGIDITDIMPELSLLELEPLEEIPVYWDYDFSSSFSLNQTFLSNWSKGGENSFSSLLDITAAANYTDKKAKTKWNSSGRLKYGTLITEEYGLRTNTDMLEFNSQYNRVMKEKIDFSASFYMKNQIARGYNFPNDSVVVSRFLNPATFTIGVGVEYKPFKNTSFNFSPLSYKNTFVLDTANIDQTLHGIEGDKRARQEMGGQLLAKNSLEILDGFKISNTLRLFSGYLNNPENIDVDWEIDLEKKISWYFTILMNLHMIYDDDVRFPVLGENDLPVLLADGTEKKVPKLQFKQFLGLTFLFNF